MLILFFESQISEAQFCVKVFNFKVRSWQVLHFTKNFMSRKNKGNKIVTMLS